MEKVIEFLRAFVRPYLAYTGWAAIIGLAVFLAVKYASQEIADTFIGALLGTVATVVGFYVRERTSEK